MKLRTKTVSSLIPVLFAAVLAFPSQASASDRSYFDQLISIFSGGTKPIPSPTTSSGGTKPIPSPTTSSGGTKPIPGPSTSSGGTKPISSAG